MHSHLPMLGKRGEVESAMYAKAAGARERLMHGTSPAMRLQRPRPVSPFVRIRIEREQAQRDAFEEQRRNALAGIDGGALAVPDGLHGWPAYSPTVGYDQCIPTGAARPRLTMREIIAEVAAKHQISVGELKSSRRSHYVVIARQEAMWRCKNETACSLPQIGRALGGKDHTTVLHGIKMHEKRLQEAAAK